MDNEAEISNVPRVQTRPTMKSGSRQDLRRSTTSKYRIEDLNEPSPRFPGVRSLLPLPGGDILTAGTDVRIRYWDHARYLQEHIYFSAPLSVRDELVGNLLWNFCAKQFFFV